MEKHPISHGQPTRETVCWREHNPGYVCILPEGHEEVEADLRAELTARIEAVWDDECSGNRSIYCERCRAYGTVLEIVTGVKVELAR